jgi:F-type H+-transporting ATPase subunit a
MFPIEIISHLARPFSLAIRLFGNIGGEHLVSITFYGLVAWLLPVPLMALGLFAAFLQTFVFIMLSQVYIAGSIAHDH